MQVNSQNIQRPSLYFDFINLELCWNSEYLTYIQTTSNAVTSSTCKIAKTSINSIRKSLKRVKKKQTQSHNIMMSLM
jgi:hypothetical protein